MTLRTLHLTDDLYAYVVSQGSTPDPVTQDLIDETRSTMGNRAGMQIGPDQAAFLTLLTKIVGVRFAVEVGTFTGYSAIAIARGLAEGGKLLCCDVSEEFTSIARRYWDRAGLADRIDLRLAPAAETLRQLPEEPHIDFAFIDADKGGYPTYWAELVPRMRPGGLIAIDNVLRDGRVIAPESQDDKAMVAFNESVLADERVESVLVPIADGLTLARRR
jgi:caffeoyl-CoA O-methyltransferase